MKEIRTRPFVQKSYKWGNYDYPTYPKQIQRLIPVWQWTCEACLYTSIAYDSISWAHDAAMEHTRTSTHQAEARHRERYDR